MATRDLDMLFETCGAKTPFEFCVECPDKGLTERYELKFPFAVIGRNAKNDLVLADPQVSRRHAYVQVLNGRLFWVDLNSRTGVHRAEGSDGSGWSRPNQAVQIGPFLMRPCETHGDDCDVLPSAPELHGLSDSLLDSRLPENDPLPAITLEFLNARTRKGHTWQMNRALALIGSAPECKVQLIDPRVSRFHASLLRTAGGLWAIDLLGRRGIHVNGERVRCGRLGHGDELLVGEIRIRIHASVPGASANSAATSLQSEENNSLVVQDPTTRERGMSELLGLAATGMSRDIDSSLPSLSENNLQRRDFLSVNPRPVLTVAGRIPAEMEVVDLGSLLLQFSKMQQQMSDQFQQAVMTMAEMFRSLHRDQMDLIREELDRLHELNDELRSIQGELSAQNHRRVPNQSDSQEAGVLIEAGDGARRKHGAQKESPGHQDPKRPGSEENRTPFKSSPPEKRGDPKSVASAPSGEDVHAWLCQRMAKIQDEQQSVWQRILSKVRSQIHG